MGRLHDSKSETLPDCDFADFNKRIPPKKSLVLYEYYSNTDLFLKVVNVFDNQSIISREPDGARPNKPRTISAGVKIDF